MGFAFSSRVVVVVLLAPVCGAGTVYVSGTAGSDSWSGRCQTWDGNTCGPKATIQAGIDAATNGETVLVAEGTYVGSGNKNLDFGGKALTVRSESGATRCIIDCEDSGRGFYFHTDETTAAVVDGFTVTRGNARNGAGILLWRSSPTIMNCRLTGNKAIGFATNDGGGGILCYQCDAKIANCTITDNEASYQGGGLGCVYYSDPSVMNCTIVRNAAGENGGGIFAGYHCQPDISSCLIAYNTAEQNDLNAPGGGGVCCRFYSAPRLTNCTIARNTAPNGDDGGGLRCDSSCYLTNCIHSGNEPRMIAATFGSVAVTYSAVDYGWTGTGNIELDPAFALDGDFHLTAGSPCVDAGTNTPPSGLCAVDLDGNPRPLDGQADGQSVTDMGAFEFNPDFPSIAVSPPLTTMYALAGEQGRYDSTLQIRNAGGEPLTWHATSTCACLTVTPSQGTSNDAANEVVLHVDGTNALPGQYACDITVVAAGAVNSPQAVRVTVLIGVPRRVPSGYATIQAAIDAAQPGDTVLVADGLYTGVGNKDLDLGGKMLEIRSEHGPQDCVIDCEASGRGFSFHSGEDALSVLDGFTITHGSASRGGAIECLGSSPTIINCTLLENSATEGGAIVCQQASPIIHNCTVAKNLASGSPGTWGGGGIFCINHSDPTISNCTIVSNIAQGSSGGGMVCAYFCRPVIRDCTLSDNSATSAGGAFCCGEYCDPLITNSVLSGNRAATGGAACCYYSWPTFVNCRLQGNTATYSGDGGGGAVRTWSSVLTMKNCTIVGNTSQFSGGGICCVLGSDPSYSQALLDDCVISTNSAFGDGGGIYAQHALALSRCTVAGNTASAAGGGIRLYSAVYITWAAASCLISDNTARNGGGIAGGCPRLVNCTIVANTATEDGSGAYKIRSPGWLVNCILWNNGRRELGDCNAPVSYSDVRLGWSGTGNISAAPRFVDPNNGDYHLAPGSPCINGGNDAAPDLPALDIDGEPRMQDCRVDMGADEASCFADCNGNGVSDACDVANGTSADCDQNGVPDECDPDCNENGVPDRCDILAGTSRDGNGDGIPDECLKGDLNCDGVVNYGDINPFVFALSHTRTDYLAMYPDCIYRNADFDDDGHVASPDINAFVRRLARH